MFDAFKSAIGVKKSPSGSIPSNSSSPTGNSSALPPSQSLSPSPSSPPSPLSSLSHSVISCSHDNLVKMWNSLSGKMEISLSGHERAVYTVAILPDGRVASAGYDAVIRIWDMKSGKTDCKLSGHSDSIYTLLVLPDWRIVSGGSDRSLRVWNVKNKKCDAVVNGHSAGILHMILCNGGLSIATASVDKSIRIFTVNTWKCEMTLTGHTGTVCCLTHLEDGRIASCSHDETIKVWRVDFSAKTWQCESSWRAHSSAIQSLIALPAGRLASSGRDGQIKIWSLSTLKCLNTLSGHTKDINALCYVSESHRIVSASSDGTLRIWNGDDGAHEMTLINQNSEGKHFALYALASLTDEIKEIHSLGGVSEGSTISSALSVGTASASMKKRPPSSSNLSVLGGKSSKDVNPSAPSSSRRVAKEPSEFVSHDDLWNQEEEEKREKIGIDEEERARFQPIAVPSPAALRAENPSVWAVTLKYQQFHHLNYADFIGDSFYDDGGIIPGVNSIKIGKERESGRWEGDIVVIDRKVDALLVEVIATAKRLLRGLPDLRSRVQMLAAFVSNKLGGMPNDIVSMWEKTMKKATRWRDENKGGGGGQNTQRSVSLLMGSLIGECGLTRHRAVLFKFLSDLTVLYPEEWAPQGHAEEGTPKAQSPPAVSPVAASSSVVPSDEKSSPTNNSSNLYDTAGNDTMGGISLPTIHHSGGGGTAGAAETPNNTAIPSHNEEADDAKFIFDAPAETPIRQQSSASSPSPSPYPSAEDLSIRCRLIRGQYQYYVPRSKRVQRAEGIGDDRENQRIGGFHAWNVVAIGDSHFVVDLIFETGALYPETSRDAMHYNRGRRGNAKRTGLTNLPIGDVREIDFSELADIKMLKDGGFAKVERAKFKGIDVVVKSPLSTTDAYIAKQFHEEARVLNSLSHPNIVQLIGVVSSRQAIIIEYVSGGDVHNWLRNKQKAGELISLGERLDLLVQSALAMQYLHGCEPPIVHRDLKTLNLLIQSVDVNGVKRNNIKVCDFGLARNQRKDEGISTDHRDMGTPAYQSPEQWETDVPITEKTDVYSFASIMLEVLTDRIPWFTVKNKYEIYQSVVLNKQSPPIPPTAGNFEIPERILSLIKRCHQIDPNERPAFPEILRIIREVQDTMEADKLNNITIIKK